MRTQNQIVRDQLIMRSSALSLQGTGATQADLQSHRLLRTLWQNGVSMGKAKDPSALIRAHPFLWSADLALCGYFIGPNIYYYYRRSGML